MIFSSPAKPGSLRPFLAWTGAIVAIVASACSTDVLAPGALSGGASSSASASSASASSSSSSSSSASSSASSGSGGAGGSPILCNDVGLVWSSSIASNWHQLAVDPQGNILVLTSGDLDRFGPDGALQWHVTLDPVVGIGQAITAGPGGRILVGPFEGSPSYRAYQASSSGVVPLWSLDAETVGLPSGYWPSRGAITASGAFVLAGFVDPELRLVALDDAGSVSWKAKEAPVQAFTWKLGAGGSQGGVVTFTRAPAGTGGQVIRWSAAGAKGAPIAYDPLTAGGVDEIDVSPAGDTFLLGLTDFPSSPTFSVGRVSAAGAAVFTTPIGEEADENLGCGLAPLPDGGAIACGNIEHGGASWLQRYSPSGAPMWPADAWYSAGCAALGPVVAIAASPDGTVVAVTEDRVVKLAP